MSPKYISVVNSNGKIISSTQFFADTSSEQQMTSEQYFYQILNSLVRKQIRKPMQILKQFILFPQQESSIEVQYKYMRHQVEQLYNGMQTIYKLQQQKCLLDGFISIKMLYQRKKQAYYNQTNIHILKYKIINIISSQTYQTKKQIFHTIFDYFKGLKLSKINQSHIEPVNEGLSKDLQQLRPFLYGKKQEIQIVNSFQIQQHQNSTSRSFNQKIDTNFNKININNQPPLSTRNNYQIDQYSNKKNSHTLERSRKTQYNTLQQKYFRTDSQNKKKIQKDKILQENDTQLVYLIRDYKISKLKQKQPKYIQIPVQKKKIKLIQLTTQKQKKNKISNSNYEHKIYQDCQTCPYCIKIKERRQIICNIEKRIFQTKQNSQAWTTAQKSITRSQSARKIFSNYSS